MCKSCGLKILASRLIALLTIGLLLWSQANLAILQSARFLHYCHQKYSRSENKYRDTITISPAEYAQLTWIKKDEIRIGGQMFDVKQVLRSNDKILLVGHYDSKDNFFIAAIHSFFDDDEAGLNNTKTVKLLLTEAVVERSVIFQINNNIYNERTVNYPTLTQLYSYLPLDAPFHPPRAFHT